MIDLDIIWSFLNLRIKNMTIKDIGEILTNP